MVAFFHMEKCSLPYIPERLHSNEKDTICEFFHGEELYVRYIVGKHPFMTKSLYELSVNRQGNTTDVISYPDDVLFNLNPSESHPEEIYQDMGFDTMHVKKIDQDSKTYVFLLEQTQGEDENYKGTLEMKLIHDPIPCNYSHSQFRISFKGKLVEEDNYRQSIGKRKNTAMSKLRDLIRAELDGMIYRQEVPLGTHSLSS